MTSTKKIIKGLALPTHQQYFRWCVGLLAGCMIVLSVHPPKTDAAPTVNGINGQVANGASITITGSGFGANGPNIMVFDDFEGGANGSAIRTGTGSATVGQWDKNENPSRAMYSNATAVSGLLSFRADVVDSWMVYIARLFPPNTKDVFVSYWAFIPAGDNWPGEGTPYNGATWKIVWFMGPNDSTVNHDLIVPDFMGDWGGTHISCNGCAYNGWFDNTGLRKGRWWRFWAWIKGRSDTTGAVHAWELDASRGVIQKLNDNNVRVFNSANGYYHDAHVNGWTPVTANSHPTFDDVYIAVGDSARARVEIGNNRVYNNCTNLAIATVTSWSDTQIQATIRQGAFANFSQVYLFVIDSNGNVSPGYPLCPTCPRPPVITNIQ